MDIKEYRRKVQVMADLRQGAIFNGSVAHASVIVENLFRIANHHIRILSDSLDARVYGSPNVVQRAQEFLGYKDRKIDILVEHDSFNKSHPFLNAIAQNQNVSVRLIEPSVSEGIPYHFMTADTDCYRFEEQKGTHKAIAVFGDPSAATLTNIFTKIEPHSIDIKQQFQ